MAQVRKQLNHPTENIDLDIPRDREGSFEPQVLKKYKKDISNIENQIISMYAKGMTTRDISSHIRYLWFWYIRTNGKQNNK